MIGKEKDQVRRERLLGDVVKRVRTYTDGGGADGVLDPEAAQETARLVRFLRDRDDPECHYWIGMLHFQRCASMPPGVESMRELRTAALHLVPVMASHPGVVHDAVAQAVRPIGDTADTWTDVALDLLDEFTRTGEAVLADIAVDYLETAAQVQQGMPDEGTYWHEALLGAYRRHRHTKDPEHLQSVVWNGRKAVELAAPDAPERGGMFSITAQALLETEDITGEPALLDEALTLVEHAAQVTPPDDPNRHAVLLIRASVFERRHARTGDSAALDRAVEVARSCVATTAEANRVAALSFLGQVLTRRAEHHGGPADLEEAVTVLRQTWQAPPDELNALAVCTNLAEALVASFHLHTDPAALAEAVGLRRRAVELSADDPAHHPSMLANLAQILRQQAHYDGHAPETIAEAVTLARAAAAATTPGGANWHVIHSTLADALRTSWEYEGRLSLLEESIATYRAVLADLPEDDNDFRLTRRNFASCLTDRYRATGDSTVLLEALHASRRLLELTPPGHPFRVEAAFHLAATLQKVADRSDDDEPLIESIDLYREAVDGLPAGHADLPSHLETLAGALRVLAERTGQDAPLDESITLFRRAVDQVTTARHVRPAYLAIYRNNLAVALRIRYERAGRRADLEETVTLLREAAAAVPPGRHRRASRLSNLAAALRKLAAAPLDADRAADGAEADSLHAEVLREAEEAYREAVATTAAPPLERVEDARALGDLLAGEGRWPAARDAFELAVGLLPMTARRILARSDQEYGLSRHIGLAADAAACALMAGDPVRALRTLEQGRGILLTQTIETRGDISELRDRHPDLAAEFIQLTEALQGQEAGRESRTATEDPADGPPSSTSDRAATAAAWESLLSRIRTRPGFADFLGVPATDTLLAATAEGPVVVVNVSTYRSDALVVTPQGVMAVPLPAATPDAVAERVRALHEAVERAATPGQDGPAAQRAIHAVLGWLWDAVAGPVLDQLTELGHLDPDLPTPRLWWSPTGQLSFLPLHAAGHHTSAGAGTEPARTVPDRIISSYTPTIRTLLHVRAQAAAPSTTDRMLVVAMPRTPGATALPGAEDETRSLAVYRPALLCGPAATHEAVRDTMTEASCVHFACHAVSEPADPSMSRLLLHDHADHPLTVADISRLHLPGARLAYLSACDTARTAVRLADEAVHIATAFQLAGFPHVVGTLWRANDTFAARLAADFHAALEGHTPAHCAHALHRCLLTARTNYPVTPTLWAPYLHTGA